MRKLGDHAHHRILIVGGLAGLALARALGQAGLTPELIERQTGWEDAGTGMYLPANGVRALRLPRSPTRWPPSSPGGAGARLGRALPRRSDRPGARGQHPTRVASLALLEPVLLKTPAGAAFGAALAPLVERYEAGDAEGAVHGFLALEGGPQLARGDRTCRAGRDRAGREGRRDLLRDRGARSPGVDLRAGAGGDPHLDHFGGVMGVLPDGAGQVPVIAPEGFLQHAVSENVYAGIAMARRGSYMAGITLAPGPQGQVNAGLGIGSSGGSVGLLAPTMDVTHNLHNLLTLRGALVRDARSWSRYLNEAIELYGADTDVVFASHHWPTWDTERVIKSSPSNATSMPTCTTRPCACSTTAPPASRSPRPSSCHRGFVEAGDLRSAAELLKHAVFAAPDHPEARQALGEVYQQLGFGTENALWRWPSGSTAPAPPANRCRSSGTSPTWGSRFAPRCPTAR